MWNRVLLGVVVFCFLFIGGLMLLPEPDPVVPEGGLTLEKPLETIDWGKPIDLDMKPATKVSFYNVGREIIVLDLETGNVTLAEGLELDEASREFWKMLRLQFIPCPSLEKEEGP